MALGEALDMPSMIHRLLDSITRCYRENNLIQRTRSVLCLSTEQVQRLELWLEFRAQYKYAWARGCAVDYLCAYDSSDYRHRTHVIL
jgi:hypothetical protein